MGTKKRHTVSCLFEHDCIAFNLFSCMSLWFRSCTNLSFNCYSGSLIGYSERNSHIMLYLQYLRIHTDNSLPVWEQLFEIGLLTAHQQAHAAEPRRNLRHGQCWWHGTCPAFAGCDVWLGSRNIFNLALDLLCKFVRWGVIVDNAFLLHDTLYWFSITK